MAQKNENEVHTTIVSVASVLGNLLDHYGLDKYAIARQVGIDIDIAYKPNDRVSTAMLQKVWQIAVQKTSDPCIGLIYAELLQPASLCGLGLSWITSDTLKDSISRLIRFQRSISTAFDLSLNELDDSYQIIIRSHLKKPAGVTFDASIATIFRMCKITYGPELKAERVTISHPAPEPQECADKFNEFFNVQVEFNAKETQVLFAKQAFENKLTSSNPDLARMNDKVVIQYLDSFDKNNVSAQVRAKIIEQLCNGIPQQDLIDLMKKVPAIKKYWMILVCSFPGSILREVIVRLLRSASYSAFQSQEISPGHFVAGRGSRLMSIGRLIKR